MPDITLTRYGAGWSHDSPPPPPPPPPPPGGSFPGDPGAGKVMLGHSATGSNNSEFTRMDNILNAPYGIARCFDGGSGSIDWSVIDYHRARGRVVAYSVKNSGASISNSDMANMNAAARAWVDEMSDGLHSRLTMPMGLAIHHEPDNDSMSDSELELFREGKRQVRHRMRVTNGCTNLTFMDAVWLGGASFLNRQHDWRLYSIDYHGDGTGDAWDPDPSDFYTGAYVDLTHGSAADVIAYDGYNWWGVAGHTGAAWRPLRDIIAAVAAPIRQVYGTSKALAHLEWATAAYCGDPTHTNETWSAANRTQTEQWMDQAYAAFLEFNVRWASWFTSFDTATHLDNFDPNRWRYSKLAELMRRPTSVRVPVT